MRLLRSALLPAGLLALVAGRPAAQTAPPPSVFSQYCYSCHNAKLQSGGLDLQALAAAPVSARNSDTWRTVARRMEAGEMPPAGLPKPSPADVSQTVAHIRGQLAESSETPHAGRVTARRLNRAEYNNTIRDL